MTPSNRCRSEPQMAQAVTLMMASRPCSIFGSGTESHRMSFLPCQVSAFIPKSPYRRTCETNFGEKIGSYGSRNDNGKPGLEDRMSVEETDYARFPTFCDRHRCVHGHRVRTGKALRKGRVRPPDRG